MFCSLSFAQSGSRGGGGSSEGIQATKMIRQTLHRILRHYQSIQDENSANALLKLDQDLVLLVVTPSPGQALPLLSSETSTSSTLLLNKTAWEKEPNWFTREQATAFFLASHLNLPQIEAYLEKDREEYQQLYLNKTFRCLISDSLVNIRPAELASQAILLNERLKVKVELNSVFIENLKTHEALPLDSLFQRYFYGPDQPMIQTLDFKNGKILVSCE